MSDSGTPFWKVSGVGVRGDAMVGEGFEFLWILESGCNGSRHLHDGEVQGASNAALKVISCSSNMLCLWYRVTHDYI